MTTKNRVMERASFGGKAMQELPYRIGILLSSYARAINKQNKTIGLLFQQKTKAKILHDEINGSRESYLENCFFYIHQNPIEAGLVKELRNWLFSSYLDYCGLRNGSLCDKELFYKYSGLTQEDVNCRTQVSFSDKMVEKFY